MNLTRQTKRQASSRDRSAKAEVEAWTWHRTSDFTEGHLDGIGAASGYAQKAREILLFDATGKPVAFLGKRKLGFDG